MITPFDGMIDKACGFDPKKAPKLIDLVCPVCGKCKKTPLDPQDPPDAVKVQWECPKCWTGNRPDGVYFDKNGKELK